VTNYGRDLRLSGSIDGILLDGALDFRLFPTSRKDKKYHFSGIEIDLDDDVFDKKSAGGKTLGQTTFAQLRELVKQYFKLGKV
jgi:hypothetical protein